MLKLHYRRNGEQGEPPGEPLEKGPESWSIHLGRNSGILQATPPTGQMEEQRQEKAVVSKVPHDHRWQSWALDAGPRLWGLSPSSLPLGPVFDSLAEYQHQIGRSGHSDTSYRDPG